MQSQTRLDHPNCISLGIVIPFLFPLLSCRAESMPAELGALAMAKQCLQESRNASAAMDLLLRE